ncbi:FHA domain-containing protein [Botrimarina sp.]|uniref:FHA domain-containing protein n=1 Tax=Botrimarina sp. TaxID=2795802 RepID=UPI0032EE2A64
MSGPSETPSPNRPRLEYFLPGSAGPRTVVIEEFPFTIGRCASAGLQIDCGSVSREHAQITAAGERFLISDLGSTNGTFVNGEPARDTPLNDGDSIRVADIDLVFAVQSSTESERMVTQPLAQGASGAGRTRGDAVAQHRRRLEGLLWVAPEVAWSSIRDLDTSATTAFLCRHDTRGADEPSPPFHPTTLRASHRYIAWMVAAERLATRGAPADLLLRLTSGEPLQEEDFHAAEAAMHRLPPRSTLALVVPWDHTTDDPRATALCRSLAASGLRLVLGGFAGSASAVESLSGLAPDRLLLSQAAVSGVSSEPRRRQLTESVVVRCAELGIQPVLPPATSEADKAVCRELGVRFEVSPEADLTPREADRVRGAAPDAAARLQAVLV